MFATLIPLLSKQLKIILFPTMSYVKGEEEVISVFDIVSNTFIVTEESSCA